MRYFYCIAECDYINKGKLQKTTQIKFENGKTITPTIMTRTFKDKARVI